MSRKLNQIELIIKGADLYERALEDEYTTDTRCTELEEVFIYKNDIENVRKMLLMALEQLQNKEIEIRSEE